MISKNMYEALTNTGRPSRLHYHDGRTLRALWKRGLIHHGFYKDLQGRWTYVISKRGYMLRNDLLGLTPTSKKNLLNNWSAG